MPKQIDTPFVAYDFIDEVEENSAKVFSDLQIMHIRTELSVVATEKVKASMTGELQTLLHNAYLQGRMEAYESLIAISDNIKNTAQEDAAEKAVRDNGGNRPYSEKFQEIQAEAIMHEFASGSTMQHPDSKQTNSNQTQKDK